MTNLPEVTTDEKKSVGLLNQLGRGHEEASEQDDIEIPRVRLVQSTSVEATAENVEDRVAIGKLINSMTKQELPEKFIPIFKFTNFIQWNPRKKSDPNFDSAYDAGALIFQTTNPNDPRVLAGKDFGANGEAPKVTKYLNFLSYFPGNAMPMILSFSKTSFNAGKRLNTLTRVAGGDMFSNIYKLKSIMAEADGTKYFVLDVAPAGKASQIDFQIAEKMWEEFRSKTIKIHDETEETVVEKKDPKDWID